MPNLATVGTRTERYVREPQLDTKGGSLCTLYSPLVPRYVHVDRGHGGFGFTLSGNAPVFIRSVDARGAAAKAGLQPGDQIMELNGLNVRFVCFSVVSLHTCLHVATEYLHFTNSSQECNPLPCCPAAEGQWYMPLPPRLLFSRKRRRKKK